MGKLDKVKSIDFSKLGGGRVTETQPTSGVAAPPDGDSGEMQLREQQGGRTAPGAMMLRAAGAKSALLQENEALKAKAEEWLGASQARKIAPALIRPSQFANRHPAAFETPEFDQLRLEIQSAGGNVQAIKVRRIPGVDLSNDSPQYEVVFGHRRFEACRQLGLDVLVVIADDVSDRELFVEMERENRERRDLSPWEQGTMYLRALQLGLYPSNKQLAQGIGADVGAVGKAIALAELPAEVVAAFRSPLELQYRWSKPLRDALDADRDGVIAKAKDLSGRGLEARQVFERLTAVAGSATERENEETPKPTVIKVGGRQVATVLIDKAGAAIVQFKPGLVADVDALAKHIKAFLQT